MESLSDDAVMVGDYLFDLEAGNRAGFADYLCRSNQNLFFMRKPAITLNNWMKF